MVCTSYTLCLMFITSSGWIRRVFTLWGHKTPPEKLDLQFILNYRGSTWLSREVHWSKEVRVYTHNSALCFYCFISVATRWLSHITRADTVGSEEYFSTATSLKGALTYPPSADRRAGRRRAHPELPWASKAMAFRNWSRYVSDPTWPRSTVLILALNELSNPIGREKKLIFLIGWTGQTASLTHNTNTHTHIINI